MADEIAEKGVTIFDDMIKSEPKLLVLSDNPVSIADMRADIFDLRYHLGPVYDLIRTPGTQMPLTIGINGKWGTGKSNAMKWLREMLDRWNKLPQSKGKIRTRNIWFCPWKYHDKEELWKGLIAEVIINLTTFSDTSSPSFKTGLKLLSSFVGKTALDIVSSLDLGLPGCKVTGDVIKQIKENFQEVNHPEMPYLNEYETCFQNWIQEILTSENKRMVIFIDDLDRCMPDIALQMLESLKLYLNIDKLIFIIGMDRDVVKESVAAYYKEKNIEDVNPDEYLDKMLQLELNLSPQKKQMDIYLDDLLRSVEYEKNLDEKHKQLREHLYQLFRNLISKHGGRNPRKIKRLINSSLIRGCGAEKITNKENNNTPTFEQGVQIFFIQAILKQEYNLTDLVGDGGKGDKYFEMWSQVNSKYLTSKKVSSFLSELIELQTELEKKASSNIPEETVFEGGSRFEDKYQVMIPKIIPKEYHELIEHLYENSLPIILLANDDLDVLMQIEYSMTIAEKAKDQKPETDKLDDATIIRQAIAKQLGKEPSELTEADYELITQLNLSFQGISNISLLAKFRSISFISMRQNQISDISPIRELTEINHLDFSFNKINDISMLSNMTNITELLLIDNQINDISVINNMIAIKYLYLNNNQISDFSPISKLKKLKVLFLANSRISDISFLKSLKKIESLSLEGNKIEDLSALMNLQLLQELYLSNNNIVDIDPLTNLNNLFFLNLNSNKVKDISAIQKLNNIAHLYISSTEIKDIEPLRNLTNLRLLGITNTNVTDLEPLKGMVNLDALFISEFLRFQNTDINDLEPISELTNMRSIKMNNTPVKNLEPLYNLTNLKELYINGCNNITDKQIEDLKKNLPNCTIK
jgi:Leucine-rich repeat (LRR) protein